MKLTKAKIIERIYSNSLFSKREAGQLLEALLEVLKEELCTKDKVKIEGLGQFVVKKKSSRMGRNPQSGKPMKLRARKVITFKPSNILKQDIGERYAHRIDKDGSENTSLPPRKGNNQSLSYFVANTNNQQEEQKHDQNTKQVTF